MTHSDVKPGLKFFFHGGWNHDGVRCPGCNFPCGFNDAATVVERYQIWDLKNQRFVTHPDLWTVQLENGAWTAGYSEQFVLQ